MPLDTTQQTETKVVFDTNYFRDEMMRFREVMGNRAIMLDKVKRENAMKGLALVYPQTKSEEDDFLAGLFDSTVQEFNRRCFYMDMLPQNKG